MKAIFDLGTSKIPLNRVPGKPFTAKSESDKDPLSVSCLYYIAFQFGLSLLYFLTDSLKRRMHNGVVVSIA